LQYAHQINNELKGNAGAFALAASELSAARCAPVRRRSPRAASKSAQAPRLFGRRLIGAAP
jgi:hypothetical protein